MKSLMNQRIDLMNFDSFVKKILPKFEKRLEEQIAHHQETNLEEAMGYSLMAPGKRLRPLILLAVVDALNPNQMEAAYPTAMALEMIHTYSLIHDDLPAMDDDELRRGLPTNHVKFGEATAILAGDALLTLAFETIAKPCDNLAIDIQVQLIADLARASGYQGMIAGQKLDIENEGKIISTEKVVEIHQLKTGALFAFAAEAGAKIAGADGQIFSELEFWGAHLGLAFQIRDDLLDIVGTEEELGKGVQSDEKHGKATYPALLGVQGAYSKLNEELAECRQILKGLSGDQIDFSVLMSLIDHLNIDQYFK